MSNQDGTPRPRDALRPSDAETDPTATATTTDEAVNAEDYIPEPGEQASDAVPVDNWVYWPPFDSADYLDAPDYRILEDGEATTAGATGEAESKEQKGGTATAT